MPTTESPNPEPVAGQNVGVEPGTLKVPILDLPSRAERRSITKTGKSLDGTPVHPDSRKNLRVALIADLIAFGSEVNKANGALNVKMNNIIDQVDLAFREVHWNFATFLSYLGTTGVLPEDFLTKYEEFKVKAGEELEQAAKAALDAKSSTEVSADLVKSGEELEQAAKAALDAKSSTEVSADLVKPEANTNAPEKA